MENHAEKAFDNLMESSKSGRALTDAEKKGLELNPEIFGYLNPIWKIKVMIDGKEAVSMPFCFMAHAYLKDYGFDPDNNIDKNPKVCLEIAPGQEIRMPLYLKARPDLSKQYTAEEARDLGMIETA